MTRNKFSVLGLLATVLVLSFSLTGCPANGGGEAIEERTTVGKLTITGIDSQYNGKWARGWAEDGDTHFIRGGRFFTNSEEKGVQVKNGEVVLPVFRQSKSDWSLVSYEGNDTFPNLQIKIISQELNYINGDEQSTDIAKSYASVTFVNGIGTIANPVFASP
jgi:hypothetical protein